jgi:hypothetical protein
MKRVFTLKLNRDRLVTLHFAINNYRVLLENEIKTPTRPHGPAESAMSLLDLEELAKIVPAVPERK